jgi:hypothetical protein
MMRKLLACVALTAGLLAGQTGITNAAVSGMVKDKVTGQPLANYTVSTPVRGREKDATSTTDSSGRYKLMDLPPGAYRIEAHNSQRRGFGQEVARHVAVNGSDVENIYFLVLQPGTISGKVVDENKEPVPDIWIRLVQREYFLGNVAIIFRGAGAPTIGANTLSPTWSRAALIFCWPIKWNSGCRRTPRRRSIPSCGSACRYARGIRPRRSGRARKP